MEEIAQLAAEEAGATAYERWREAKAGGIEEEIRRSAIERDAEWARQDRLQAEEHARMQRNIAFATF